MNLLPCEYLGYYVLLILLLQSQCDLPILTPGMKTQTFFWKLSGLFEGVTGPCKYAVNRACGHLGGPLGFSKLFLWAASGTPGASTEGKKFRLGSFEPAVGRRTDRLHFCNGLWRPGPSHPIQMQSIWPSHGALVNMQSIGLAAICGAPSGDLEAPKNFF